MSKKIEVSEAQLPIVMYDDQLMEKQEDFYPLNYTLYHNINVKKEYKSENVVNIAALEFRQLKSHSKNFSISSSNGRVYR